MDIFSVFSLCGGLAFFLFGMHIMSNSLEKVAGGKLELLLKKMTSNPFKSLLLGAGITIAIQSSSALTVMLVGLVNSGIMDLSQTVGLIMGSNIGTTLTAWILSLAGLEGDNFFLRLLKPESFSPLVALIGIIMIMACKSDRKKDLGTILVGFAVLMYGMELMKDAVSPLAEMPEFEHLLVAFTNPILGVIVGALFTALIQSSAASVGILQALALTGSITFGMAIPIIMGQNIGTCITSMLSSIGVSKNAKRVAAVHVSFNVIGTVVCLSGFCLVNAIFHFSFTAGSISPVQVAMVHSIFNLVTTLLLLPFSNQLVKLATVLVPGRAKKAPPAPVLLDERLMRSPSFAVAQCREVTLRMADLAKDSLISAMGLLKNYSEEKAEDILAGENEIDHLEDALGSYLVKLSACNLTTADSNEVSELLHLIGDFERIGDHAVNVLECAQERHEKNIDFSAEAKNDLTTLVAALTEILNTTVDAFHQESPKVAARVEPLEEVIDDLTVEIKNRHIHRLQNGACTIELGFILTDLLTNLERVSDHCSNVAVCIIQVRNSALSGHGYLHEIKNDHEAGFAAAYAEFAEKYRLQ